MYMYIVGYKEVFNIMQQGPFENFSSFLVMVIFTAAFYFTFAWFREQVCTLVCPYGRLQGVLIDKQTINVYYDFKRGENRSKWRKGEDRDAEGKGDCLTALLFAEICEKVGLPKGLIRYATEDEIEKEVPFKFTNRMKAYSAVLLLMIGFLGFLLGNRGDMEAKFIKPAGSTYFVRDGKITNIYNYTFLNKSTKDQWVLIKVIEPDHGKITLSGEEKILLKKDQIIKGTVNLSFPEKEIKLSKQKVKIGVYDPSGKLLDSFDTTFEGPFKIQF